MRNQSYKNVFDLYENETACRTHFQLQKVLHLDLFRNRGTRELGNGPLIQFSMLVYTAALYKKVNVWGETTFLAFPNRKPSIQHWKFSVSHARQSSSLGPSHNTTFCQHGGTYHIWLAVIKYECWCYHGWLWRLFCEFSFDFNAYDLSSKHRNVVCYGAL